MVRLAKMLVLAVWVVGAVPGGLTVQLALPPSANESLALLVNTDYMDLGVTRTQGVLVVTPPWQSEWKAAAPLPDRCDRSRPEKAAVQSEALAAHPVVAFLIRSLVPLP
ncbi:hypothetical protein [Salinibacter ruber]|uniref:hypothetical protein n=1 Tax=Salinibacter ruber TaxID=146919 RepID=UPI00216A8796|nr:hypothetical protein [Salinibacter ruber]